MLRYRRQKGGCDVPYVERRTSGTKPRVLHEVLSSRSGYLLQTRCNLLGTTPSTTKTCDQPSIFLSDYFLGFSAYAVLGLLCHLVRSITGAIVSFIGLR